eukprot:SAG11_NODE_5480_length_1549_cov_3.828276_1_plen_331_part_10
MRPTLAWLQSHIHEKCLVRTPVGRGSVVGRGSGTASLLCSKYEARRAARVFESGGAEVNVMSSAAAKRHDCPLCVHLRRADMGASVDNRRKTQDKREGKEWKANQVVRGGYVFGVCRALHRKEESQVSGQGQVGSGRVEPAGIDGGHPVTNCDASDLNVGDSKQNKDTSADSTSMGSSTPSSTSSTGRSTSSPSHATASTPTATGGSAEREGVQARAQLSRAGPASSDAPPLGDACYGGAQGLHRPIAGGDLFLPVSPPIVERPGSYSQVSIDEVDASNHRPLPRTDQQEALSAGSRSILPGAGADPIDASPTSGSDRPRPRASPHGDMRG